VAERPIPAGRAAHVSNAVLQILAREKRELGGEHGEQFEGGELLHGFGAGSVQVSCPAAPGSSSFFDSGARFGNNPVGMVVESLGAFLEERGGVTFRAYSTVGERSGAGVVVEMESPPRSVPLVAVGDGVFEATIREARLGTLYKLRVGDRVLPDPYARWLPSGVHGPAEVVSSSYPWKHPCPGTPLERCVVYELHVGTFTPEGTYTAASARLPELARLGVTAVELMPIASFPGLRGWGYDGVAQFAPYPPYGTPDELRAFVDEAHGLGLSVLLDVVYNHFGPSGNYLAAYSPEYFTQEVTLWGDAPNFENPHMRRLVVDSARHWLEAYRFDGLRLDSTHSFHDPSPRHVFRELVDSVASLTPHRLLFAEDESNDPALVLEHGFDAIWADDFHHQVHALMTGERDGYYGGCRLEVGDLARIIERGWLYEGQTWCVTGKPRGRAPIGLAPPQFLFAVQNHDQAGNRAEGERLSALTSLEALAGATMLLLFLPHTPLLFMGQEWGATSPFLYFTDHEPDLGEEVASGRLREFAQFEAFRADEARARIPHPQAEATFLRSKLDWDERSRPGHRELTELVRAMLALRREDAVLGARRRPASGAAARVKAFATGKVLAVQRSEGSERRLLLTSFDEAEWTVVTTAIADLGRWELLLDSGLGRGPAWKDGRLAPGGAALFRAAPPAGEG